MALDAMIAKTDTIYKNIGTAMALVAKSNEIRIFVLAHNSF